MAGQSDEHYSKNQGMMQSYKAQDVIAREGEAGIGWFVLSKGHIGVFIRRSENRRVQRRTRIKRHHEHGSLTEMQKGPVKLAGPSVVRAMKHYSLSIRS